MHSKMGLLWYEVVIKGAIAKRDATMSIAQRISAKPTAKSCLWKLAPFFAGIACTSATGALAATSNCLSQVTEVPTDFVSNINIPDEMRLASVFGAELTAPGRANTQQTLLTLEQGTRQPSASRSQQSEQKCLSWLTQETYLQAQNLPVTPPVTPENLQPNPNEDRFLQEPPTPAPIPPDSTPSIQPSPTPETTPSTSPLVQPSPTPETTPPLFRPPIPPSSTPETAPPLFRPPIPPSSIPETRPPTFRPPVPPSPDPETPTLPPSQSFQVQKINVTGSTVFGSDQFNPIVQPFEGRTLTLEQLREIADKITQLYLDKGYITSRAIVVNQAVTDGVVEIRVIEGSLEEIRIEGTRRLNPGYIRRRIQLGAGTPLNTGQLEDQLRLLRADPLFENVEASLRAGSGTGKSILIVRIIEANPFEGSVGIDNYSPPSVGSERLGLNLLYRNLTGNGDGIAASYYHTTKSGADSLDLSYRVPLNAMNGALQLRTSLSRNKVVDPAFSVFNIQGDSQLYEISFQQPLVRSPREEFALSLGFTFQESKALIDDLIPISPGADPEGITTTSVIRFGQDYLRRDVKGAWSVRSLFSIGTGLFGATINDPPTPDGRFFSWLGQVQRVQVLGNSNFLIIGADIQLTPNSLLPSQQFVIGGGQSLRGYRQNIRAGDNGVRFSVEDRITLQRDESGAATFQLAPFVDAGVVWNDPDNPIELPSQRFLAGVGLGVLWEALPGLNIRVDYGLPLVDLEDRGRNVQDDGFYFSVRYQF